MLQLLTANLLVFPPVSSGHAHFAKCWCLLHWLEALHSFGIRLGAPAAQIFQHFYVLGLSVRIGVRLCMKRCIALGEKVVPAGRKTEGSFLEWLHNCCLNEACLLCAWHTSKQVELVVFLSVLKEVSFGYLKESELDGLLGGCLSGG